MFGSAWSPQTLNYEDNKERGKKKRKKDGTVKNFFFIQRHLAADAAEIQSACTTGILAGAITQESGLTGSHMF